MAFNKKCCKNNDNDNNNVVDYNQRERWANKWQFVMATLSYGIGLGNIWRFPYLCYKNGGAAFLIPYFILLIFAGLPILFVEVAIGQYFSTGPITVWNQICPLFKGIGYGTVTLTFILNCYYVVVVAWVLVYFYNSFSMVLPWSTCDNPWNTERCFSFSNSNLSNNSDNLEQAGFSHNSHVEFWENKVLQKSGGIDQPNGIQPELAFSLFLVWILCFFCILKGIKSTGKAVYFTAILPLLILLTLFIRSVTLPGAIIGIRQYIVPDFDKLFSVSIWTDAASQVIFSYGLGIGCWTALGSYNKFNNNFSSQIYLFTVMNFLTSFIAGFTVFSVLGYMAYEQNISIDSMAKSGFGLAFVTFPRALSTMPVPALWSALFFGTLLLLGFGSQFVSVDCFITAIVDLYPGYLRIGKRRHYFIGTICLVNFLIGLSMVTRGGIHVFNLFDKYGASTISLTGYCFLQVLIIGWVYNVDKFAKNIEEMVGYQICSGYRFCWKYITPIITGLFFLNQCCMTIWPKSVSSDPTWSLALGWFLILLSLVMFPIGMAVTWFRAPSMSNKCRHLMKPINDTNHMLKHNNILV